VRLFNKTFRNKNNRISKTTVMCINERFEESGSAREIVQNLVDSSFNKEI